ncbi:organic cation transporter protein-like [Diadema setosum]|uniref:organic cation transporter protein-like n=1 Tax=Diadema setosum TaxID=31175 RepID=UPI003B3AA2F8
MELDEALQLLGDFGCYQSIVYVLICLVGQWTQSWHMLAISFLGAVPDHRCSSDDLDGEPWELYPVESDSLGDGGEEEPPVYSSCELYTNYSVSNATEECSEWTYNDSEYGTTIATEWDLVCNHANRVDLSTSIFMAGVMVGSLLFGQLSDRFGRKPIWFASIWAQVLFGVGVAFSPNYWTFVALRFVVGVFEQGVDLTSYVMVTEMFSPGRRGPAGILLTMFWAAGIMSLPGLAYLIKDWSYLQLAITLPNVLTLLIVTIIPESMRWLLTQGRADEAEQILQKFAKFNGKELPQPVLSIDMTNGNIAKSPDNSVWNGWRPTKVNAKLRQVSVTSDPDQYDKPNGDTKTLTLVEEYSIDTLQSTADSDRHFEERHHTLIDLFRTTLMRKLSIIMIFVWFVNSVIYYGLSLNTDSLVGNPYLNFFISGAVEVPAYILAVLVVRWIGRRLPLCIFHIVGGVACVTTVFIPAETKSGNDLSALIVTIAMVGKFCISASYAIVFLYASELFPTVVRNLGLGVSSFSSRVGGIVAPLILLLDESVALWLPMSIFGTLSVLAGLTVLPLPETLGRTQPQTVRDAEDLHRRSGSMDKDTLPFAAHINLEENDTKL